MENSKKIFLPIGTGINLSLDNWPNIFVKVSFDQKIIKHIDVKIEKIYGKENVVNPFKKALDA